METHNPHCYTCTNTSCIIKRNCHLQEMAVFLEHKSTIRCKKGQNFIIEGAPIHGLYFINHGKVKVAKTGLNGKEQIVRLTKDGDIIGHRGFGAGQAYHISATALEDTTLCNFSTEKMKEMLQQLPSLSYDLMTFYAEELSRSETKVKKFAQMTVREKVIDAFLYINRKFGQKDGFFDVKLSRKEIADFAGTTDEQVIRIISSLKKEGLIQASGRNLGIKNVELLRKEISEHNYFIDS
ncbi:Crp/Fnr family transcriptional regulator [Echinicola vietnamensis]|uniref:cAMP-binding protein n=1 Tax=Echinicola vietnamensis (strain DSM 17526 / LMG 23754 / KMM 6221) TaxID=926556 RepID=L0FX81_ECHVK|nr:Crp/Fnr family transcriptional regulator [Echinicola vietnamensis]AGA77371.1 cAMP-binding protein [Echinicola vietnamensis DSM 17526]